MEMQRKEERKKGLSSGSLQSSSPFSPPIRQMSSSMSTPSPSTTQTATSSNFQALAAGGGAKKGMQLGGMGAKSKMSDMLEAIRTEEGISAQAMEEPPVSPPAASGVNAAGVVQPAEQPQVKMGSVHLVLDEKLSATVNRDGGMENLEVKGELLLRAGDAEHAKVQVLLSSKGNWKEDVQFKTHPQVDKGLWSSQHLICPRDHQSKPFPVGQLLPVLKWRFASKDEGQLPFNVTVWPTPAGGQQIDVSAEYEFVAIDKLEQLRNVLISIPLPTSATPKIDHIDGEYSINPKLKCLEWRIPLIDSSNSSGTLEFSVSGEDVATLFPVRVTFSVEDHPFCDVDIATVKMIDGGQEVDGHTRQVQLSTDDYRII